MKQVIITGMPGSGKSEVREIFSKAGFPVIIMGDIVRDETRRRGYEPTHQHTKRIMLELRELDGPGAIAKLSLSPLQAIESNLVVIEGCRSLAEVDVFKEYAESVSILCVHSSPDTRFSRLRKRARADAPLDWERFLERDMRELSVGLGDVIALSDIMLVNEGGLEELHRNAEEIVLRFK